MSELKYLLAQVNIARARAPLDTPLMADFVNRLDEINALAERSPGFLWRLQTPEGNATDIRISEDERTIINLTVWDSLESLHAFTYRSTHKELFRQRKEWFEPLATPSLALWWLAAGQLPTVADARERLACLAANGPTPRAFTFVTAFPPGLLTGN